MSDEMKRSGRTFTFELANAVEVKEEKERVQTVPVVTDMMQRCSKCRVLVVGKPLGLSLVDVIDSQKMHDALYAVATAMFEAEMVGQEFYAQAFEVQQPWMKQAGGDGWTLESFSVAEIGKNVSAKARMAGMEEAKKWGAYTDRRKVFRVTHAQFPPGWLFLSFETRGKTGEPVRYQNVGVHICPDCAPEVFKAAGVDPKDPFGRGGK